MTTIGLDVPPPVPVVGPGGSAARPAAGSLPRSARQWRAAAVSGGIAAVVIGLLAAPLLFTKDGFASDFTNLIWLSSAQSATISHGLLPSYFINTTGTVPLGGGFSYPYPQTGLLDPIYTFYGGPLLAITGALSALLGQQVIAAFVVVTLLAFVAAYRGVYWCARQARCRRSVAHAAAITYVGSAYYITDLYGRGDWIEFVAVSALPLFVAASAATLWGQKVSGATLACLYIAAGFLGGSHNTTLLWGSIFVLILASVLFAARAVHFPTRRRVVLAGVAAFLGVGLNGWAIIPGLAYSSRTNFVTGETVIGTPFMDTFGHLFDPFRMVPKESTTPALYVQVVVWMLAWALLTGLVLCVMKGARRERLTFLGLCGLGGLCLFFLLNRQVWGIVPHLMQTIQNPFLLSTYFTLSVVALVIAVGASQQLRDAQEQRHPLVFAALAGSCAITLALAGWQVLVPNDRQPVESYVNRYAALTATDTLPKSWYAGLDWVDEQLPVVNVDPGRFVTLSAAVVNAHGDGINTLLNTPDGPDPIGLNIVAAPYLQSVGPDLKVIGRTSTGYLAVVRGAAKTGPAHLVVGTARSVPVAVGRAWTVLSLVGSLIGLGAFAIQRRRPRRRAGAAA